MLDILNLNLGTLNVKFSLCSVTGDVCFCQEENAHKVYANTVVKSTANLDEKSSVYSDSRFFCTLIKITIKSICDN